MDSSGGGGGGGGSNQKDGQDFLESGGYRQNNHHDSSNHHPLNHRVAVKITIVLLAVGIVCLILNQSAYPTQFFQRSYSFSGPKESITSPNLSSTPCDNRDHPMPQNVSSSPVSYIL